MREEFPAETVRPLHGSKIRQETFCRCSKQRSGLSLSKANSSMYPDVLTRVDAGLSCKVYDRAMIADVRSQLPSPGLQHLRLVHRTDGQPFHRARHILGCLK